MPKSRSRSKSRKRSTSASKRAQYCVKRNKSTKKYYVSKRCKGSKRRFQTKKTALKHAASKNRKFPAPRKSKRRTRSRKSTGPKKKKSARSRSRFGLSKPLKATSYRVPEKDKLYAVCRNEEGDFAVCEVEPVKLNEDEYFFKTQLGDDREDSQVTIAYDGALTTEELKEQNIFKNKAEAMKYASVYEGLKDREDDIDLNLAFDALNMDDDGFFGGGGISGGGFIGRDSKNPFSLLKYGLGKVGKGTQAYYKNKAAPITTQYGPLKKFRNIKTRKGDPDSMQPEEINWMFSEGDYSKYRRRPRRAELNAEAIPYVNELMNVDTEKEEGGNIRGTKKMRIERQNEGNRYGNSSYSRYF